MKKPIKKNDKKNAKKESPKASPKASAKKPEVKKTPKPTPVIPVAMPKAPVAPVPEVFSAIVPIKATSPFLYQGQVPRTVIKAGKEITLSFTLDGAEVAKRTYDMVSDGVVEGPITLIVPFISFVPVIKAGTNERTTIRFN